MKQYWVYILTNVGNTVLYTGVANNLHRRIQEHRSGNASTFTSKYKVTKLVYYERFARIQDAIAAEKKIKAGSRARRFG
jgi:putative endonuclease